MTVNLPVQAVTLQIHLQVNSIDRLVPVTVKLTGNNQHPATCVITFAANPKSAADFTCGGGAGSENVSFAYDPTKGTGYLKFGQTVPGQYAIQVTSTTTTYRDVLATIQVVAGIDPQQVPLSLDERFSNQQFQVSLQSADPIGSPADGNHTVLLLAPVNNVNATASNANGAPMTVNAETQGTNKDGQGNPVSSVSPVDTGTPPFALVTFNSVPDGQYWLVATHAGYQSVVSASPLVFDSTVAGVPTPINLTTRAQRPATIFVNSTATPISTDGTPVDLSTAKLSLAAPTATYTGLAADQSLSNLALSPINGKYGTSVTGLGTGDWTVGPDQPIQRAVRLRSAPRPRARSR